MRAELMPCIDKLQCAIDDNFRAVKELLRSINGPNLTQEFNHEGDDLPEVIEKKEV